MAKKLILKFVWSQSNPNSKFIYYAKKPTKGEKAKDKLKLKNIIPIHVNMNFSLKKNFHP